MSGSLFQRFNRSSICLGRVSLARGPLSSLGFDPLGQVDERLPYCVAGRRAVPDPVDGRLRGLDPAGENFGRNRGLAPARGAEAFDGF